MKYIFINIQDIFNFVSLEVCRSNFIKLFIYQLIFLIIQVQTNIMKDDLSNQSIISNDSVISQIDRNYFKDISFFSKQFCLPKEIRLNEDRQGVHSFQNGLLIVQRENLDDITPSSRDVIDSAQVKIKQDAPDQIRFINGDGLISMFKHRVDLAIHARVAICVTVYTEDKLMLKRTLQGIKLNYASFLTKAGILSHQIVVVVIFDGIQKINDAHDSEQNMISYFRELDLMNGFRKKQYIFAKRSEQIQQQQQPLFRQQQKYQLQNYNDEMLFTEKELEDLEDTLFETQYHRYMEMCKILNYVKELSKKDIQLLAVAELPRKIRKIFIEMARNYLKQHNIHNVTDDDDELQKYLQDNMSREKLRMIKLQAIKAAENIAKDYIQSRQSTAILYQIALPITQIQEQQQGSEYNSDPKLRFHEQQAKMYTFFVVKHKNSGKLSSHLWFFEGFCNIIQPDMCVLIDCGLKPAPDSIFKMWAHIQTFKSTCGGVCGYMSLNPENPCDQLGYRTDDYDQNNVDCLTHISSYLVDIQKAQLFEYHFAHMIDKPFQSCFGYIHVLPGAFSGYNWDALKHQRIKTKKRTGNQISVKQIQKKVKEGILKKYLKTVIYNQVLDDIKEANMYLAEDRILCLEIYAKKKHSFNLQYLPDAQSEVDPVTSLIRMLGQRKRWINGSWFALQYVLDNRKRINESEHNNWDRFKFRCNMFYSAFNKALSYVGISIFYIIMHFMIQQFAQDQFLAQIQNSLDMHDQAQLNKAKIFYGFFSLRSLVNSLVGIVDFLYIMSLGTAVYYSLTLQKNTKQSKRHFYLISTLFGIYGLLSVVLVFYNFISTLISKSNGTYQILDSFIQSQGILNVDTFIYLLVIIVVLHLILVLLVFDLKKYFEILISLPSYFFFVPSYLHLFFIYAFCRIDDLSWGTKGLDSNESIQSKSIGVKFKNAKLSFVFRWICVNISISLACVSLSNDKRFQSMLIWGISFYVIITLFIRSIFAIIYLFKYYFIIRREVRNTTLSERKRLERIEIGRECKTNLKQYIQQVKNQNLDHHILQINEELRNQSRILKIISEQENNYRQSKQSLFQNLKLANSIIRERESMNIDHEKSQQEQIYLPSIQNMINSRIKKKPSRDINVKRKKIYVRHSDTIPILAQIFKSKPDPANPGIDFQELKVYSKLNKIKQQVRNMKIIHKQSIEEQNEMEEEDFPLKINRKHQFSIESCKSSIEQQKLQIKSKIMSVNNSLNQKNKRQEK